MSNISNQSEQSINANHPNNADSYTDSIDETVNAEKLTDMTDMDRSATDLTGLNIDAGALLADIQQQNQSNQNENISHDHNNSNNNRAYREGEEIDGVEYSDFNANNADSNAAFVWQDDSLDVDGLISECAEAAESLHSIRDFIRFCVTQMRSYDVVVAQGSNDVFAEAAAIVLHTLALDWSADEQILDCRLTQSEKQAVLSLLQTRIISRKPLSYLINLAYFCGMPFYVDERVLIPRSPIAELIRQQFYPYFITNEFATSIIPNTVNDLVTELPNFYLHGLPSKQLPPPTRILDLCTGSGCIAIALAHWFKEATVEAADIDTAALEVAAVNVEHHNMMHQVNLVESDLFNKLPPENQYELIVTNPPYVDAAAMAELPPEFEHEPEHALAAGQDGLDLVHHILHDAADYLTPEGLLVCEVGDSDWALRQTYPQIDFNWLTFANGGHGIFAIDCATLNHYKVLFAEQVARLSAVS